MTPNPFVGPRSIGGSEHKGERIYGRDREVADLMDLVITERVVLVYSPSGAGKSSLLQAGLVPAMEKRRFTVRPVMRVKAEPPPEVNFDPSKGNRYALSCLLSLEENSDRKTSPVELSRMSLLDYLGEETRGELLIFDQFEEILTVDPLDTSEKLEFFGQVGDALRSKGRWAVFAMREDYLAGIDPYADLVPTRFSNTFRLDLLKPEAAVQAIRGPAEALGVDFREDAATELVSNLRQINVHSIDGLTVESKPGLYVEPVQLQVVCFRLWRQLAEGSKQIAKSDLADVGDVDAALGGYYDDSVSEVSKETGVSERDLRDWFEKKLITKQNTRGQVVQGSDDTAKLHAALKPLVDSHLVRSDKRLGSIWYELAHDRLIAPVRKSNAKWRGTNLSPLQKQTELWIEKNSKDRLLSGGELSAAKAWAAVNPLREEERQFLEACAAEQLRLEELEKSVADRKRGKRLLWVALAATLAAGSAAVGILIYRSQNIGLEQEAEQARQDVKQAKQEVEQAGEKVKQARDEADRLRADGTRDFAELTRQGQEVVQQAKRERDEMLMMVLRETPIESMLDDGAAGGEVKPADGIGWLTVTQGPEKRPFAVARDLGPGRGRIIGVGHVAFLNYVNSAGGSLFLKAAIQWVKRERSGPIVVVRGDDVQDARQLAERLKSWKFESEEATPLDRIPVDRLKEISVLVLAHKLRLADGDVEAIRQFVEHGGGLVVTGYGWVYAKYHANNGKDIYGPAAEKLLDGYWINVIMKPFGVRWTNEIARYPK